MLAYVLCFATGLAIGLAAWWRSRRHLDDQLERQRERAEAFHEAAMASDHRAAIAARWRAIVRRRHWRETQRPALP